MNYKTGIAILIALMLFIWGLWARARDLRQVMEERVEMRYEVLEEVR